MASYGGTSNRPTFNPYGQRYQPSQKRGKYQCPWATNSIFSRLRPATLKAHKRIFKPATDKNRICRSPSWEHTALYKRMEGNYTRSMSLRNSTEISDPIQRKPTSWNMPSTFSLGPGAAINPDKENRRNAKMWGYPGGSKPTGRLYKQRVFSTHKKVGIGDQ